MNFWTVVIVTVALVFIRMLFAWGGETMTVQDLKKIWLDSPGRPSDATLIDVREPNEYSEGHVPGARNVPLGTVAKAVDSLKPFKTVYVICRSGARSANACQTLQPLVSTDTRLVNIDGGTLAWIAGQFPVEK